MRKEFMLIASVVAATFANDARINALGGSSMFDDASFIYSNPAYVTEHKIIQGNISAFNFSEDTDGDGVGDTPADEIIGSAIGTWHLNEKIVLGGYFNQGVEKHSLFDGVYAPLNRSVSPHLLVGLKLSDEFSLGIDAGLEHNDTTEIIGDNDTKTKQTLMSLDLGANMELGNVAIDASVGVAIPSAKISDSNGSNASTDTTTTEVKGMALDIEAYATLDVNELDVTAGVNLNTEKIEDTKAADGTAHPKGLNVGIIAGVAKEFDADFTLGLEAQAHMMKSSNTENDSYTKAKQVVFIAAAEKEFGQTRLFDTHSFRLAYAHDFTDTTTLTDGATDDTETKYNGLWGEDVGLSAGFGFTRGKFGMDLYVSNVNFDFSSNELGILDVIPVAGATMTIDFAKKGSTLRGKKGEEAGGEKVEW